MSVSEYISNTFPILKRYLPFFLGLISGLLVVSFQVIGFRLTHYPGDLIDGRFCNYLLEHAHLFFAGQVDDYWNAPFMFPESEVISYSENLLGTAPFYSLFRLIGYDRETAYQYWYLLVSALNYAGAYLLLMLLVKNKYAASIGAFVFAFSLALHSQMGHAQTMARFPIPLMFCMAYLFLKELDPIYFFLSLLFLVYQIYCGIYIGFMLVVPTAIFFMLSLWFYWKAYKIKFRQWVWWVKMIVSLCIAVLLVLPLLLPYLARANSVGLYTYDYVSKSLLTPLSYLFSWNGSLLWDFLSGIATHYEWYTNYQVFAGGIATLSLFMFFGIVLGKGVKLKILNHFMIDTSIILFFWVTVITFLSFMRFGNFSVYQLLFHLPGFASMRALQRIINIELIFYAIAVAFVFSRFFTLEKRITPLFFVFSLLLCMADNYMQFEKIHHHEKAETKARMSPLLTKLKDVPPGTVISFEPDSVDSSINDYHLDAMLSAQSLHLISMNGYSSTSPGGYSAYWSAPNEVNRLIWLDSRGIKDQKVLVIHDTLRIIK